MPEHSYIHEDKPGKCPICGMTLIPVMAPPEAGPSTSGAATNPAPLETNSPSVSKTVVKPLYTCPMHPDVISDKPGKCPECGMDLVPIEK